MNAFVDSQLPTPISVARRQSSGNTSKKKVDRRGDPPKHLDDDYVPKKKRKKAVVVKSNVNPQAKPAYCLKPPKGYTAEKVKKIRGYYDRVIKEKDDDLCDLYSKISRKEQEISVISKNHNQTRKSLLKARMWSTAIIFVSWIGFGLYYFNH